MIAARLYGYRLAARLRGGVAPGLRIDSTLEAAEALVSKGDVVIDVGALGGDWSYVLARKV